MTSSRVDWDAGVRRAQAMYPSTRERDWSDALRDYDLLGALVADLLALAGAPKRRGQRPKPTPAAHGALLARMIAGAEETTNLPYAEAVALAWPDDDVDAIADRVGADAALVAATLAGAAPPAALLEATAHAMGRRATYFPEYRSELILAFLAAHFERVPEASVRLATHLEHRTRSGSVTTSAAG